MTKTFKTIILILILLTLSACVETNSKDDFGNKTREFSITQTANVNNTKIKINSVKKILSECSYEYQGECYSITNPKNNYFLIIDLTIENTGNEDLNISSIASFELKDITGEKGEYAFLTKNISSQLDGSVMPNDLLKGQIAYDVKESDTYYFYYRDSLLDSNIKFIINASDILE